MQSSARYRPLLHILNVLLCLSTFLLIFVGGMVTSTHSGLSVPDWPTTYNYNMFLFPPSMMVGGIFYEHGHRLMASVVGLFMIAVTVYIWIVDKRAWMRWTAVAGVVLVTVQGVLGGLTVLYKLPMPISVAHGAVAELFLLLTLFLAYATSPAWGRWDDSSRRTLGRVSGLALVFCLAVFLQILAGAVLRHSGAGMAIPTFPLAFGSWVPGFWNFGIVVHFLHSRLGAVLVSILGIYLAVRLFRNPESGTMLKWSAAGLVLSLSAQIILGALVIWTGKLPVPTTLHVSLGALIFMLGFLVYLMLARSASIPEAA